MKRLLVFCTLLISTWAIAEPQQTYLDLSLNYGGLRTKDTDYAPFSSYDKTSHQVGGLGFGLNAGYLFDSYQFSQNLHEAFLIFIAYFCKKLSIYSFYNWN